MAEKPDPVRAVAERLLGDESLRGALTDDGFTPLLNWGLAALKHCAGISADRASLERQGKIIHDVIAEAVAVAETGRFGDMNRLLALQPGSPVPGPLAQVKLGDDADENAIGLAVALTTMLTTPLPLLPPKPTSGEATKPPRPGRSRRPKH